MSGKTPRYLRDADLAERYGTCRATIWRWASRGILPKPVRLGPGTTRWNADEISEYEASRGTQ